MQRFNRNLNSRSFMTSITLSLMLSAATVAFAQNGNPNPGIHPPNSNPYGMSYGEWSASWWHWIFHIPTAMNPNLDTSGRDCAQEQSGHVWFLAGSFGPPVSPAVRTCTVPSGTSLLIPILTTAFGAGLGDCLSPGWGNPGLCDVPSLRASAAAEENNPRTLELSIDGVELRNLAAYRAQSPPFPYKLTSDGSDNIVGFLFAKPVPNGAYSPAVADGYWVMFTPLPPGMHTIHVRGVEAGGFANDVTYRLTVEPERK